MNVLFVTRGYPSKDNPMNGNYESIQAQAIRKLGHRVAYISISFHSFKHTFYKNKISYKRVDDIDIITYKCVLPIIPFLFSRRWHFNSLKKKAILKVYKKCVEVFGTPDIIHSHTLYYSEVAIFIKERFNIPVVFTEHLSDINKPEIGKELIESGRCYSKADAIIAVSKALSERIKHFWGINSVVINNMVEDRYFNVNDNIIKNGNVFRFIAVGSARKIKGFDLLIKAFYISKFDNNVFLDIIGAGEEFESLKKQVEELGLKDQIILHGLKTPDQVSNLLSVADAFVLSSYAETFGIVLIEAMAKGLPVVATKCGGPEEFVNEECGLLIPTGDSEAMSNAMTTIYKEKDKYNPQAIRDYCYSNFSQDVIAKKIINIYNEVLQRKTN